MTSSTSSVNTSLTKRKKRRAPAPLPPAQPITMTLTENKNLMPSQAEKTLNKNLKTPLSNRKKRPAPQPPSSVPMESVQHVQHTNSKSLNVRPEKLDVSLEINSDNESSSIDTSNLSLSTTNDFPVTTSPSNKKLIPLEHSLINDECGSEEITVSLGSAPIHKIEKNSEDVVYRRSIVPLSPLADEDDDELSKHDRQWVKIKENKESQNKNRQSQLSIPSPTSEIDSSYTNKSSYGKWKRRKGPAPSLPIPPRKILQIVPLQEIRHELEVIESQQQGLEKQVIIYFH